MNAAPGLDASAAVWLAARDSALARLPDAVAQAGRSGWTLHEARWTPAAGCRLAYLVTGGGQDPALRAAPGASFVAVDLVESAWSSFDYRDDPELPGLRAACDPVRVVDELAPLLDRPIRACRITPVRYRPGSRCVLRYDVDTGGKPLRFYAKVFSRLSFDELSALHTVLSENGAGFPLVAPVLTTWPQLAVMVGSAVEGRSLSEVLADRSLGVGARTDLAAALGARLAELHGLPVAPLRTRSPRDQHRTLSGLVSAIRCVDPRLADRFVAVVDELGVRTPPAGDRVLAHGGFRAGQVILADSGEMTILDLDGVTRGDAGRDLATAMAHMTWQAFKRPDGYGASEVAEDALLSGYSRVAGDVDPSVLTWWRAAALLQVGGRRFRRLELADWSMCALLVDAAEQALERLSPHATPPVRAIDVEGLLDARRMTTVLRTALAPVATHPRQVTVTAAAPLASAADRRCVVRYAVSGLDGGHPVPVIGKAFAEPRRATRLYEQLRTLAREPFCVDGLSVPQPLALIDRQLVLYRASTGSPLDRICEPAVADRATRAAARWLSMLHRSSVTLPRRLGIRQELRSTQEWAQTIGRRQPELLEPARRLALGWAQELENVQADEVPLHKDFHAGHVLVGDDVCVIDLDEARHGDPAFDVAHFCTYLAYNGDMGGTLCDAFLREYAAGTGWKDTGSMAAWTAYTWLKIAKQLATGSGPWPPLDRRRTSGAADAVARGLTCLDR